MSRVQLALNVADIDGAVAFYSALFATGPAKVRPGYANFVVSDPPLKLVLIEVPTKRPGSINHLGVEVPTIEEVASFRARATAEGLRATVEDPVDCCHALQHKTWVSGVGGESWEIYTVLADAETGGTSAVGPTGTVCCAPEPDDEAGTAAASSCG